MSVLSEGTESLRSGELLTQDPLRRLAAECPSGPRQRPLSRDLGVVWRAERLPVLLETQLRHQRSETGVTTLPPRGYQHNSDARKPVAIPGRRPAPGPSFCLNRCGRQRAGREPALLLQGCAVHA